MLATLLIALIQDDASSILERQKAAMPPNPSLALFRLDWTKSFAEAAARAAKERRPILFFWSKAARSRCDISSGHC